VKVNGEFEKGKKLMVRSQKVGRSGTETAEDCTFDYAKINEERRRDWRVIWHTWERKEMRTGFWSEIVKERDCLKYLDVIGDNIKMDFKDLK
jgi:hypothetical protein